MNKPYEWFTISQFLIDTNKPRQLTYLENKEALIDLTRLANLTVLNEENAGKKLSTRDMINYLYKTTNKLHSYNIFFFVKYGRKMVVSKAKNTRYIPKRYYEHISGFIDIVIDESLEDVCIHNLFHLPWDGAEPLLEIGHAILKEFPNKPIINRKTDKSLTLKTYSVYIPETDLSSQILLSKLGYNAIDIRNQSIRFSKPVESEVSEHIQHISELN